MRRLPTTLRRRGSKRGRAAIADAVGLGAALDYLTRWGSKTSRNMSTNCSAYATEGMLTVPGLHLSARRRRRPACSRSSLDGLRTEDIGKALDEEGIAVRAGHHCAQPILRRFGQETTVRATLAMYNTCEDVDALVAALHRIQRQRPPRGHALASARLNFRPFLELPIFKNLNAL